MSSIFADMPEVIVYIDDICVITKGSFQDHLKVLEEVFSRLQANNLQVNGDKSKFFAYETEFLGFVLTREGLRPQDKKIDAVMALQVPKTVKHVRSILGLVNYYKQFIPHRSTLLAPLTNLTKKSTKFKWTDQCQTSLDTIKKILAKRITLAYPNFNLPFDIYTDASTSQLGSVIQQNDSPIAFYSRKLTDAQTRYTVTELELLSIVETLQEYRTILLGQTINIYTDHKNLTFDNLTTDRVRRWRLIVEEYGPNLIYIKGCNNIVADFLSRYPRQPTNDAFYFEDLYTINNDDDSFPLSFPTISNEQQNDARLMGISNNNPNYTVMHHQRVPIIYYNNKIVLPQSLQRRVINWYHTTLLHPGIDRTIHTLKQHFHWQSLSSDVENIVRNCTTCAHYKKSTKHYGLVPTKIHSSVPWETVCVDLAGPWTIPQQPTAAQSKSTTKELLVLTIMDLATTFIEMIAIPNKSSLLVSQAFDRIWLCRYPRPLYCIHDSGTEFTGFEFQELLSSYGIKSRPITVANPQANSVLERAHQTMANQMRSIILMSLNINTIDDMQQQIVSPVQWALNTTYHTTLQATAGQLAFSRDMILPTSYLANWATIHHRKQHSTDVSTARENSTRIPHHYDIGDKVLLLPISIQGKLAKPSRGPYEIVENTNQHVNGTVTIRRNRHTTETINIRRLRPYSPSN